MQAAVLLAQAKLLACDKAAFPETEAGVPGAGFVLQEATFGGGLEIQRKTCADQLLVQARRFALDGAKADMALPVALVGAEIVATDGSAASQFCQLLTGFDTAGPGIGLVVDVGLVEFRRIDAVEPVSHLAQLDGVAVSHNSVRSPPRAYGENDTDDEQRPNREKQIS